MQCVSVSYQPSTNPPKDNFFSLTPHLRTSSGSLRQCWIIYYTDSSPSRLDMVPPTHSNRVTEKQKESENCVRKAISSHRRLSQHELGLEHCTFLEVFCKWNDVTTLPVAACLLLHANACLMCLVCPRWCPAARVWTCTCMLWVLCIWRRGLSCVACACACVVVLLLSCDVFKLFCVVDEVGTVLSVVGASHLCHTMEKTRDILGRLGSSLLGGACTVRGASWVLRSEMAFVNVLLFPLHWPKGALSTSRSNCSRALSVDGARVDHPTSRSCHDVNTGIFRDLSRST